MSDIVRLKCADVSGVQIRHESRRGCRRSKLLGPGWKSLWPSVMPVRRNSPLPRYYYHGQQKKPKNQETTKTLLSRQAACGRAKTKRRRDRRWANYSDLLGGRVRLMRWTVFSHTSGLVTAASLPPQHRVPENATSESWHAASRLTSTTRQAWPSWALGHGNPFVQVCIRAHSEWGGRVWLSPPGPSAAVTMDGQPCLWSR